MECTILLNKNRNLAALGNGRISIVLRKHISRGRGKCAQRHGRIVGGNGHVLGAARHHLTGGLIHKLDGDGKFLISVIRSSVSVLIRSPDSVQSDIVCNGQCAGYKLHICFSFFGLDQSGLSSAPAEESSAVLFETAATQDSEVNPKS